MPKGPPPPVPAASASILLLSPTNQVLLLHRVHTSSAFPSAHVFPGGNLSAFHEGAAGPLPAPAAPDRHADGPAYRLAAIRETFEESGILLARRAGSKSPRLLEVPAALKDAGRAAVHADAVRFVDWVAARGGVADVDGLVPFTRWVTPYGPAKRFTTQMYLYMLPLAEDGAAAVVVADPAGDGGREVSAGRFDDAGAWLGRARRGEIVLFPPQYYLLSLLAEQLRGEAPGAQREALRGFLARPEGGISWAEKVMSPVPLGKVEDGRVVLGLEEPGPELRGSGRGGDGERVMLCRFVKGVPLDVEVRKRRAVVLRDGGSKATLDGEEELIEGIRDEKEQSKL